jgi:hypothetical protein
MRFFCDGLETGNPGNVTAASLFSLGVEHDGTITVTTLCTLRAGVCAGAVTCDVLAAEDHTFDADITATTQAVFVNCRFTSPITITNAGTTFVDALTLANAQGVGVNFVGTVTLLEGSDGIGNQSGVSGATVTDALNAINDAPNQGAAQAYATGNSTNNGVTNTYQALDGSAFAEAVAGSLWALTAAGCVYTYSGPSGKRFRLAMTMTVRCLSGTGVILNAAIDHNSDVIGENSATQRDKGNAQTNADNTGTSFAHSVETERIVTLSNGDTIQPAIGSGDTNDWRVDRMTLLVYPLQPLNAP